MAVLDVAEVVVVVVVVVGGVARGDKRLWLICSECLKGTGQNRFAIRSPLHPRERRCSSVEYSAVFYVLAPFYRGAATTSC